MTGTRQGLSLSEVLIPGPLTVKTRGRAARTPVSLSISLLLSAWVCSTLGRAALLTSSGPGMITLNVQEQREAVRCRTDTGADLGHQVGKRGCHGSHWDLGIP